MNDVVKLVDIPTGGREPLRCIVDWLAHHFQYLSDQEQYKVPDVWPTREDVSASLEKNEGVLVGDCDDHAFAAVFLCKDVADLKARVVLCYVETGDYHAVCETEQGWVLDNRFPGRLHTWDELERTGYKRDKMSGFFEYGDADRWVSCASPTNASGDQPGA